MRVIFWLAHAILAATLIQGCSESSNSTTTSGISVDPAIVATEVACITQYAANSANNYVNYAAAIGAPEVTDSVHSGLQPCATFMGSRTGNNQVALYKSPTQYPGGIQIVVQGGPNAAFLIGGTSGNPGTVTPANPLGSYVARFNPLTGAQVWLTSLPTPIGQWVVFPSMGVIADGSIVAAVGATLYRLNPDTGQIVAQVTQPILGGGNLVDANLDGFMLSPAVDSSILMKTQSRPNGCTTQGNYAMGSCAGTMPFTTVIAANPNNLKNIASLLLNETIGARPAVVNHNGTIYMDLAALTTGLRVIWNPTTNTLTQDMTWSPSYLLAGETQGAAPVVIGNWVMFSTNGKSTPTTPACAALVSQDDPTLIRRICPWGGVNALSNAVTPNLSSVVPANFSADPENGLIFMYDMVLGGVTAISLDQNTGALTTIWSRPDWKISDYLQSIGPANKRVLISQYIDQSNFNNSDWSSYNYQESVMMVDQATGKTLAQSALTSPTGQAWMITPGYGGLLYGLSVGASTATVLAPGSLNILQVASCNGSTDAPSIGSLYYGSLTNCATNYSTLPQPSYSPTALLIPQK